MLVKLPRRCSGQEIVKTFKAVSGYKETSSKKWEAQEFVVDYQFEPGSSKRTIQSLEVIIRPFYLRKKFRLFGEGVWKTKPFDVRFILQPLILSRYYNECELVLEIVRLHGVNIRNQNNPSIKGILPVLEKILDAFYGHLNA